MQLTSPPPRRSWVLVLVCASVPFLTAGCGGPSTGKVSGKVTMSNGEALPGGTISFIPSGKGNVASTWIKPDGTYELEAPAGECKISIDNRNVGKQPAAPIGASGAGSAPPPGSGPGGKGGPGMPPGGAGPPGKGGGPALDKGGDIGKRMGEAGQQKSGASGEVQPGTLKPINSKYYDPQTSGLTYTVKGGAQTYDIKVE